MLVNFSTIWDWISLFVGYLWIEFNNYVKNRYANYWYNFIFDHIFGAYGHMNQGRQYGR